MRKKILWGILILLAIGHFDSITNGANYNQSKYEIWQAGVAYPHRAKMECQNQELGFSIKVVVRELDEDIMAHWLPGKDTIEFQPGVTDIDTIAHEVYHATQTMKQRYGLGYDEELSAYMQGGMTGCVYKLIHNVR